MVVLSIPKVSVLVFGLSSAVVSLDIETRDMISFYEYLANAVANFMPPLTVLSLFVT